MIIRALRRCQFERKGDRGQEGGGADWPWQQLMPEVVSKSMPVAIDTGCICTGSRVCVCVCVCVCVLISIGLFQ